MLNSNTRFSILLKAPRHKKMRGLFPLSVGAWCYAPKPPHSDQFVFCCQFCGGAPVLQCNTRFLHLLRMAQKKTLNSECFDCFSRGLVLRTKTAAFRSARLLLSVLRRRTCVATQHEVLRPTEGVTA